MMIKDILLKTVLEPMNIYRYRLIPSWAVSQRADLRFLYLYDLGNLDAFKDCYLNFLTSKPDIEDPKVFTQFWLDNIVERYNQQTGYFHYLNIESYQSQVEKSQPELSTYHAALAMGYWDALARASRIGLTVNWPVDWKSSYRSVAKFIHKRIQEIKPRPGKQSSHRERKSI